jgi:hypothetical protein
MRQIIKNGNTIDLNNAAPIVSREAIAMFSHGNKIYKLFNRTTNSQTLCMQWQNADRDFGLPTPYVGFYDAVYVADAGPGVNVRVIEMKKVQTDRFFQFSHGGVARLQGWISSEADAERLKKLRRSFEAAKWCGLMDPQGFYLLAGKDPVLFIDVHTRKLANDDFNNLINAVEDRVIAMTNAGQL